MSEANRPLIVGAGPVGLGAALFLARRGVAARVVEARREPARQSKALAINPRTLEILEPTGITARMLELGLKIRGACFHRGGRVVAEVSLAGAHPTYPFMLALSQAATERLLAEALAEAGGTIERGVSLVECRAPADSDGPVEAVLEHADRGGRESVRCPWLLAADGAHSTARREMNVEFAGSAFDHDWHLADVPLRTRLAEDHAHVFLLDDGFRFMVRVVDPALAADAAAPVWRVMSPRPDPLTGLTGAEPAGEHVWASSFRVAHRLVTAMSAGRVFFAGDAAHVHSPVGARGMNLGLEDAWVFAHLAAAGRLAEYDALRRPVDRRVVRRVEVASRMVAAESATARVARQLAIPLAPRVPFLRWRMARVLTGTDHALPRGLTGGDG